MDENNQGLQWSHIEPLCILRALARQLWMLLLAALTCAMAAWIVLTCFVTQQYTSSTTFSVTTRTSNLYYTNITAAADVAASYSQLLQSRVLRQTMEQNLGMPLNAPFPPSSWGKPTSSASPSPPTPPARPWSCFRRCPITTAVSRPMCPPRRC